jgi:adenylate cyclase
MTREPATICLGCWQNLHVPIPLRGPLSAPFRLFGIKPSRMNPNTCTICEMAFSRVMKARAITVDATVMFADLRGYTTLTQSIAQAGLTSLLDAFYDDCAAAIWRYDGLLNKTIGDAVFAIFNFPVRQEDHAAQALMAARNILERFSPRQELARAIGAGDIEIGIGIGIDSGETNFGEFGQPIAT